MPPLIGSQLEVLERTMNLLDLASLSTIACHAFAIASPVSETLSGLHNLWHMHLHSYLLCPPFVIVSTSGYVFQLHYAFTSPLQLVRIS